MLLYGSGNIQVANADSQLALKDAFKGSFLIGAALNESQFSEQNAAQVELIRKQFNSITAENVMKWEGIHPQADKYDFVSADRFVEFGERNEMFIIGHTLVWHSQTPRWVFRDETGTNLLNRDALLARMREHIHTVVGRYKGRVKGWDVVNEALYDSGLMRQSQWFKIIGEDYVVKAFQFAHEADPNAELYYNDYSLENAPKRNGAIELVKKLKAQGVPVAGVGLQGHYKMKWPSQEQIEETVVAFANLGLKVMITELDVDVVQATQGNTSADIEEVARQTGGPNTFSNALPQNVQQQLAQRYADIFAAFLKQRDKIDRVTFWGVSDGDSWLNRPNRANHPLLFDRQVRPKPAFEAVIKTAQR
jgi:endo-1,4-beta-xylanase